MTTDRRGAFWDMIDGRRPAPPSARLLGWRLERIDPEILFLEGSLSAADGTLIATATARVIPFEALRSSP